MANNSPHQTHYTRQTQSLLAKVYGRSPLKDSLLEQAISYFSQENLRSSDEKISTTEAQLLQLQRAERCAYLLSISLTIFELAEGGGLTENNRKSARFLGTIQLLSTTEGKQVAESNERSKSVYKAVLCLRLLDDLIINGLMNESYIKKFLVDISPEQYINFSSHDHEAYLRFSEQVKIPLIMAALLQDIGNYHPRAQRILCGEDNKLNPYRTLDTEQRKKLLRIDYSQTIKYLNDGIGMPDFVGNTKADREQFLLDEQGKLTFINQLLKQSVNPKKTIGNLLKVPQIYTSIILSTKPNYKYKVLPQVFQVLNRSAELGICEQAVVDALYKVTGMFPQGYGVVYVPSGEFSDVGDCYEYAIVNSLYPKHAQHPHCRMTTRKLTYMGYGQNIILLKNQNLYFSQTANKLARLSKERLHEILSLLSSNAHERQQLDLLPRCWHANEFFSLKAHQNLWNN
ncbi:MAG: hypothetical protein V5789_05980 [Colwellia sp.]